MPANSFVWCELMTTDLAAARTFYADVVGWKAEDANQPDKPYVLMKVGDSNAAGLMVLPDAVQQNGGRPSWVGYIGVGDINAAVARLKEGGGMLHRGPEPIPTVGQFAVVADPQGAMFMLLEPVGGEDLVMPSMQEPGQVGWRELYATDWQAAFDFYSGQFGWTKGDAVEMGPMGTYQLFKTGGADDVGGIMNKPAAFPRPFWGYYFNVTGIDAAAERVKAGGGAIMMGPHEVPGGTWVVQCTDPQGAAFALSSPVK